MSKITLYYAEWCGHCQTFKPVWKNIKKDLEKNNIEYKEYEHSKNSNEISNANIQGFPTIRITRNNKTYDYEGPRTQKDILKEFGISSQSGGQRDNCDDHSNKDNCDEHRNTQKINHDEYSSDPSYYGIRQGNRNKQSGGGNMYYKKYLKYKAKYMKAKKKL